MKSITSEYQAYELDKKWLEETNRFDKVEYLLESCRADHIVETPFLNEMVNWMSESAFTEFFARHCSLHNILLPNELKYQMSC